MKLIDQIFDRIEAIQMAGPDPFPDETIAIQCHPDVWRAILVASGGCYAPSSLGPILMRDQPGMKYLGPWPVRVSPLMAPGAVVIGVHHFRVMAHLRLPEKRRESDDESTSETG